MIKRKKGYFSISAVAKMFSVHQQTIRLYEKEGLISPKRSDGNTRLFSEDDVNRLEEVIYLTHELGINLAGVEMILKLKRQISKMQKDMNNLFDNTQQELEKEEAAVKETIKTRAQQLIKIKQESNTDAQETKSRKAEPEKGAKPNGKVFDIDDWEIEYEE
jgi:MerR family transcriptional regulator/heat shock protein HspR